MKKFLTYVSIIILFFTLSGCEKTNEEEPKPVSSELTNGRTTAVFNSSSTYGTLTDQDGNIYKTITIGSQTWMAENLRTTKYRDGSNIKMSIDDWSDWTQGYFCEYNNTSKADSIATFGRLYNWNAIADSRNIAPAGWHVPTAEEWQELITTLGGGGMVGGKLKETAFAHWESPNMDATNESGFTAIPGGYRTDTGQFTNIGKSASFWCSDENSSNSGINIYLSNSTSGVGSYIGFKSYGFSVRLVKD